MTDDQREKDIDRLIEDIQAEKQARGSERPPSVPGQPGPGDQLTEERKAKVSGFRLQPRSGRGIRRPASRGSRAGRAGGGKYSRGAGAAGDASPDSAGGCPRPAGIGAAASRGGARRTEGSLAEKDKKEGQGPHHLGLHPWCHIRLYRAGALGYARVFSHYRRHRPDRAEQIGRCSGRRYPGGGLDRSDRPYPQGQRHHRPAAHLPPLFKSHQCGRQVSAGDVQPDAEHGVSGFSSIP